MIIKSLKEFVRLESASGIFLLLAAVLAMLAENSAAKHLYDALLGTPVEIKIGDFEIAKPLLLWINDGLMAVFFFLIGLEVKREILAGELSEPARIVLPIIAAIGGMAAPAFHFPEEEARQRVRRFVEHPFRAALNPFWAPGFLLARHFLSQCWPELRERIRLRRQEAI